MDSLHWRRLDPAQAFYSYQPQFGNEIGGALRPPVIFLQPRLLEHGNALAELFREDGFADIYAYTVRDTDDRAAQALGRAVDWLLAEHHPHHQRVILVGCAGGGLLGRRYVLRGGCARVAFLFTLGSAHRMSLLSHLEGAVFESQIEGEEPLVAAPSLGDTVMVNVYSDLAAVGPAGGGQGVHLPDAVNLALPVGAEALCRDRTAYEHLRRYMAGDLWLVTVRLRSLLMQGESEDGYTGPFCFEVNGWRAPLDGVFRVALERRFDFNLEHTLLGTLTFPMTAAGRAVDIDFRLKDLSMRGGQRRKLLTSLHTPLRAGLVSEHVLQDSLGSEVGIQVRCDRPQTLSIDDYD